MGLGLLLSTYPLIHLSALHIKQRWQTRGMRSAGTRRQEAIH